MIDIKKKEQEAFKALKDKFGYTSTMQSPRFEKVSISTGVGSTKDKKKIEVIQNRMEKISGQKPSAKIAKKSIATFKLREGDTIGYAVTLRGQRMYDFLDKLINISFPRTRDFRGLPRTAIDEMGNITLGIKEHIIFPETPEEELKDIFGLSVTVVTSAKNKEEAEAFLEHAGFPFKKIVEKK